MIISNEWIIKNKGNILFYKKNNLVRVLSLFIIIYLLLFIYLLLLIINY